MSIAWIYAAAAEVVNVVMMFGSLFGISYQVSSIDICISVDVSIQHCINFDFTTEINRKHHSSKIKSLVPDFL